MTKEQATALAAVRAAFVAARTTGLTDKEILDVAISGARHTDAVKSGRPPGNYNPTAESSDDPKK
jgi:hypothetical protein